MNHSIRWTVIYSACWCAVPVLSVDIKSVLHITDQPNKLMEEGWQIKENKKEQNKKKRKWGKEQNKKPEELKSKSIQWRVWEPGRPLPSWVLIGQIHFWVCGGGKET